MTGGGTASGLKVRAILDSSRNERSPTVGHALCLVAEQAATEDGDQAVDLTQHMCCSCQHRGGSMPLY